MHPPARAATDLLWAAAALHAPGADGAVVELRTKGLAAASKKASRRAAEGLVGVAHAEGAAAIVEVR